MRFPPRLIATIAMFALLAAMPAQAAFFNPHLIMTDATLRDSRTMTYPEIRAFLDAHGGLANRTDVDPIDGVRKNAAQLIYDAAQRYNVNPQYLIALLQKESSTVNLPALTIRQLDWAAGYALCDDCSRQSALARKYKGLAKQIDAGAGWIDWYYKHAGSRSFKMQPGQPARLKETVVIPGNLATAALYTYTPHIHGNRLLWSILNEWFADGTLDIAFPDGTLVRNEKNGAVALIQGGRFRPILKRSVLQSRFNEAFIVDVNEFDFATLERHNPGPSIRFSDYSLIRVETGDVYLLAGKEKRKIASTEAFAAIGFNPEEVEDATVADLADYALGEEITADVAGSLVTTTGPTGVESRLVQDPNMGGVYAVELGVKRPLWDKAILMANYPGRTIYKGNRNELDRLPTGDPVPLRDGTLVKAPGDATVYVIAGGKRRAIPSEEVFAAFGYAFSDVLTASPKALALCDLGEPLTLMANDANQ